MSESVLRFVGADGEPVTATLHRATEDHAPLVILCHGFKGFREWGFWPCFAERLAASGFAALRIDFSHNGVRERDYDRLDLFERDTWTRHQQDLAAVLASLYDTDPTRPIALVGHSRGGADALFAAEREPRVAAVVAIAPVSYTRPDWPEVETTLERMGHYPVENTRTKQWMPVGREFFADAPLHDPVAAARRLAPRPLLVIHGDADTSVPLENGRRLVDAHGAAELVVIEGANHAFGATHPFRGPSPELRVVFEKTVDFLRSRTNGSRLEPGLKPSNRAAAG